MQDQNREYYTDADFSKIIAMLSLGFVPLKAVNSLILYDCNQVICTYETYKTKVC